MTTITDTTTGQVITPPEPDRRDRWERPGIGRIDVHRIDPDSDLHIESPLDGCVSVRLGAPGAIVALHAKGDTTSEQLDWCDRLADALRAGAADMRATLVLDGMVTR